MLSVPLLAIRLDALGGLYNVAARVALEPVCLRRRDERDGLGCRRQVYKPV